MPFLSAETTVSSAVATSGTFTVGYPNDDQGNATNGGNFTSASGHKLWVEGHQWLYSLNSGFTLSFGATEITVTYTGTTSIPANSRVNLQLDILGRDAVTDANYLSKVVTGEVAHLILGAPDVADPNGICESQSASGAVALSLDGALVSGGVATLDVPRNIVVDSGGADTAVLTITGTDEYGATVVENITLNGTTAVAGKKAFKTVTGVSQSATTSNGVFVGTGDVLGLPARLPATGLVLAELEDGATATAGTLVAGVTATATATTGDVRGTYDPNSAADGSASFSLVVAAIDPADKGVAQYAG